MKKYTIIIFLVFALLKTQAQDYLISFAGSGDTSQVGSVIVDNLTSGNTLTLNGGDILHLTGAVGIREPNIHTGVLQVYPNPFSEQTILTVSAPENGNAVISIVDVAGRTLYQLRTTVSSGTNSYHVSGLSQGMYFIKVTGKNYTYSTKLISQSKLLKLAKIEFISSSKNTIANPLKSTSTTIDMPYTEGDILLYKSISGQYSTIVTDVPTGSKTITFNFVLCKDNDGSNYSTVTIGAQTWMAENLKTKTYKDGTSIPLVTEQSTWGNLQTGGYCWYNNDSSAYNNIYGALYNWFAVNTGKLAPAGWHIPSDKEWTALTTFLGNEDAAGGKMKETGTTHWKATNTSVSNMSGFSGLPGGCRDSGGLFKDITERANFWTKTEANSGNAWLRELQYNYNDIGRPEWHQEDGYSVRCLKDQQATTPNPLNVVVVLDTLLASSSMISKAGGTLTAQGPDGTKYTLTLPNGALNNDEIITIIPITSIEGLNFSGAFVGGVQMAPEGLRLLQAAILTIESPKVIAASGFETVAFGYDKNGDGLYLNLPEIIGNQISVEVWHFSGGAAAQATPAEVQTHYSQYIPSAEENAFYQKVCEFLGRERQAELLGLPPDELFEEKMIIYASEGYDKFVAPLLPIALQDCAKAPAILSRALSCARQMVLLGWDETIFKSEYEKIMETIEQVLLNCHGWKMIFADKTFINCGSPYGPWNITYDLAGGTYSYYIPYSDDGKSTITSKYHHQDDFSSLDISWVSNATFVPDGANYIIKIEACTWNIITCADGDCYTQQKPVEATAMYVYIADSGECK